MVPSKRNFRLPGYSRGAQPREATKMKKTLLSVALVVFAASASAQDRRPDYGPAVNAAAAKKIAAGIIAECQKNIWNVAVAVVDTHGFLVYFERMDNTQTASMDIALGKAKAAATIDVQPASSWM